MGADGYGPPRILLVGRRMVRKNKYVNFVGDFHLDLILEQGAVPVIIPRSKGILRHLEQFEPFHGLLLTEGEDVDPASYGGDSSVLSDEERAKIAAKFSGDTVLDPFKDELEMSLIRICAERGLPILSICRGSQLVNATFGGDLYFDLETQLGSEVCHYDADNYDGHRHELNIEEKTPMHQWFGDTKLIANSYHHCGVKTLAPRFRPMACASDGLVEAFYDPSCYDPANGQFIVGIQFHPERMQSLDAHLADEEPVFDHPGCRAPYEDFVTAATAHVAPKRQPQTDSKLRSTLLSTMPRLPIDDRSHWRARFTVHGGTMALSLLHDGIDPVAQMDRKLIVPADDVSISDGKVVVDLRDPLELDPSDKPSAASAFDEPAHNVPVLA